MMYVVEIAEAGWFSRIAGLVPALLPSRSLQSTIRFNSIPLMQ